MTMSSCGVSVDIEDLVKEIIKNYGDQFADEIIKKLDLSQYVKVKDGIASGLTLKDKLIADEDVKGDLCSMLQDCIAAKIKEELGCDRDDHVISFAIDKTNDLITIDMKFGEKYSIGKEDLKTWLDIKAGGVIDGRLIIRESDPKQILHLENKDGTTVEIDLSALKNTRIISGRVKDGNLIQLNDSDGGTVDIDVSSLDDLAVSRGEIVDGRIIRLHMTDNSVVDINASTLVPDSSPYVVSGEFVTRSSKYYIVFKRNDNVEIPVEMTDIINELANSVYDRVMSTGYRINSVDEDYELTVDDFDARTIIRASKDGDQTITIPKPVDEGFKGKAIIIRKVAGEVGTFTYLSAGGGVTLIPNDSNILRRIGSSISLIYVGDGVYDIFGELT